jgi:hypothetical protein
MEVEYKGQDIEDIYKTLLPVLSAHKCARCGKWFRFERMWWLIMGSMTSEHVCFRCAKSKVEADKIRKELIESYSPRPKEQS